LNHQLINERVQTVFRSLVRKFVLDTRKAQWARGHDKDIPNLTIDQLIEFAAIAFAAVTTVDITRSYEICGSTK